jgi:hypothetical protein
MKLTKFESLLNVNMVASIEAYNTCKEGLDTILKLSAWLSYISETRDAILAPAAAETGFPKYHALATSVDIIGTK